EMRFGVRLHVLSRETETEAIEAGEAVISGVTPEYLSRAQATIRATDSAGESRQRAFTDIAGLWPEANLWAGIGQVRRGVGVTVVGSHEQVARKFLGYVDMGLSFFILSGYPHLEEAENAGKTWLPMFWELYRQRQASLAAG
ncbi:MAG: LLM class flavin-dependent oxidoreductase, partial [Dehalococcoidia bacterium]